MDAYPLSWPLHIKRKSQFERKEASFKHDSKRLTIARALRRLDDQITLFTKRGQAWRIDPNEIVVSTNLRTRLDGGLRSGQRDPEDPAIAVYFELDGNAVCMPCDSWTTVADNIAAVAAHMDALRRIERYGVTDTKQAFANFMQLEDLASWWQVLGVEREAEHTEIKAAYKRLMSVHHPDKKGDRLQFQKVQDAWRDYQIEFGSGV